MMEIERARTSLAVTALAAALTACSGSTAPAFPDTIAFGGQPLKKATSWARGGLSGIVYVPPGLALPGAALQVGAIVSTEHTTSGALHAWIARQFYQSGQFVAHDSGGSDESCRVGVDMGDGKGGARRIYMTLVVCKTGVARAACVEADETLEESVFTTCLNNSGCFQDVCDRRSLERREALDLLAADMLAKR